MHNISIFQKESDTTVLDTSWQVTQTNSMPPRSQPSLRGQATRAPFAHQATAHRTINGLDKPTWHRKK
jgi:hypothetical protein